MQDEKEMKSTTINGLSAKYYINDGTCGKLYFNVSYDRRNEAKVCGCRYDCMLCMWYLDIDAPQSNAIKLCKSFHAYKYISHFVCYSGHKFDTPYSREEIIAMFKNDEEPTPNVKTSDCMFTKKKSPVKESTNECMFIKRK